MGLNLRGVTREFTTSSGLHVAQQDAASSSGALRCIVEE